jgi:hypothetical protein
MSDGLNNNAMWEDALEFDLDDKLDHLGKLISYAIRCISNESLNYKLEDSKREITKYMNENMITMNVEDLEKVKTYVINKFEPFHNLAEDKTYVDKTNKITSLENEILFDLTHKIEKIIIGQKKKS